MITASTAALDPVESGGEDPIGAQIKDLIDTRIRPAATENGGDVTFRGFKDGVAYLEFHGSAWGLMNGIENMLRHYVPEVEAVKDHRDALPKPGLVTPEGKAIQDRPTATRNTGYFYSFPPPPTESPIFLMRPVA